MCVCVCMTTPVLLCSPMFLSTLRSLFLVSSPLLDLSGVASQRPRLSAPTSVFICASTPSLPSVALIYATQFPIPSSFQASPNAPVLHWAQFQHFLVLHAFHLSFLYGVIRSAHLQGSLFDGKLSLPNALPDIYTLGLSDCSRSAAVFVLPDFGCFLVLSIFV